MDLHQLEYVLMIAETRSLSKAAEKLFISPSALSQYIGKLEKYYGAPFFERSRNTWRPTRAGEIYIRASQEILRIQKNTMIEISEMTSGVSGALKVGLLPGRTVQMFASVFKQFQSQYPGTQIRLCEESTDLVLEHVADGDVDIAFLTGGRHTPKVRDRFIAREDLVLVLPKSHPLAARAQDVPEGELACVDLREFKNDAFLLAWPRTMIRKLEDQLFEKAGFEPKVAFENLDLTSVNTLALNGFGPTFMLRHSAFETGNSVLVKTDPGTSLDIVASFREDHYLTKAEQYLITLAENYYRT
ncbi:MAG: LysR family transcriptional regulator [Lachnospiraceae bacterium]|nr:LysR family transcriptional regulator [Lachnospiraceae bacterium]